MNIKKVNIAVTIPPQYLEQFRKSILEEGAGIIENYTFCSVSTKCTGTFIANEHANPYIGVKGKQIYVEEEKLEVICDIKNVKKVIKKIKEIHPYETPVIDIIPLLDEEDFKWKNKYGK